MAEDKTKAIQTQNVKLGERVLQERNLELVLPNWKEVIEQVEQIRKTAIEIASDSKKDDKFDFNNVISILGERGSGKSSVLLTLRKKLMNLKYESGEMNGDVFLDVIVPEMLEDSSDILGVILLNFKTYIEWNREKINKHYQKVHRMRESNGDTFNSCLFMEKNQLDILWDKVFSLYIYRKKGANKVIEENFSGVSHYTEERKEALVSELELSAKLRLFFDELICALNGSNPGSHLIFICFDDVDLNPKRCNEVLNVVLKYMNYPNIVTFISGDIDKFQEDMVSELLLQHEGYLFINENFVGKKTMLESQKELVYDFLKKIMPYSRRFSLRKLNAQSKMNFHIIESDPNESKTVPMKELIGRFFDENERPYEYDGTANDYISSLFQIFDDKPRGLLNVYSYLYSNDQFINNKSNEIEQLLAYYQKLFEMIIETNSDLRKNREYIQELYTLLKNEDMWYQPILLEIHHDKLRVELIDNRRKLTKMEVILIIHLLYFIESMVKRNVNTISGKEYSQDLNLALGIVDDQRLIPYTNDVRNVFAFYSELNRVFDNDQMASIFDKRIYANKYFEIIDNFFGDYEDRFSDDSVWLEHYKYISDHDGKKMMDIKDKILDDFKEFEFDLSILDKLDSGTNKFYIEEFIEENRLRHLLESDDYEVKKMKFVDYSLFYYFSRTINASERDEVLKNTESELNSIKTKLQIVREIMLKNQFRMSYVLSKEYIKLDDINKKRGNVEVDVELAIKEIKLFKDYLRDEINFFINTRSKANETLLKIRVGDGRIKVKYPRISLSDESLKEISNYLEGLKANDKKAEINTNNYVKDHRIINWIEEYPDFSELHYGTEGQTKKGNAYVLYFMDEGIPPVTKTRTINAFNRYALIHFYSITLEALNELLGNLESSQIIFLLQNLQMKISESENGRINEEYIFEQLEWVYYVIEKMNFSRIKSALNERNALNTIYKMRNDLLLKFESLEVQYQSHEIDIHQLGKLITKLRDETLISELKSVQRRLLTTGSVNKDSFDTLIKRMETYLNSMNADSYATIELKGLADNLCKPEERNAISMEINRVRNEARERLYQLELEQLIKATAYVYDRQASSKGALV